jgi:hypothetical protein
MYVCMYVCMYAIIYEYACLNESIYVCMYVVLVCMHLLLQKYVIYVCV